MTENKLRIYIAGKVNGEDQNICEAKFAKAQKEIEAQGLIALNPLELVGDWSAPWKYAMKLCIIYLMTADAVVLLPDYEDSRGARLEYKLACELGIKTIYMVRDWKSELEKLQNLETV